MTNLLRDDILAEARQAFRERQHPRFPSARDEDRSIMVTREQVEERRIR
ncbi:hypothetical protein [Bradyrhizobium sp. RD5-C2]|nr:hypothetical protein [Bradyrhizobium sp. RD5-C2]GIQ75450.1 hypothetical protein BraRD5C2_38910 [Bradyrhizobium sp. RD5-C2]